MKRFAIIAALATLLSTAVPTSANLLTSQVTVGTTATLLLASRPGRRQAIIVQHGTTDVSIGGSAVTTSTGLLLTGTEGTTIVLETTAAIYGIVGSGTQVVSVAETF